MEDFEIRQVFSIIKDRVNEIKKDQDWKEKIAQEWNDTAAQDESAKVSEKKESDKQHSVFDYSKF